MNKAILSLLTASVLFSGCATPPAPASPTASLTQSALRPGLPSGNPSGPTVLEGPIVLRSSNLSLIVQDPAATIGEMERRIEEAGGYVSSASTSSSSDGGYANLSARVPLESLTGLRLAVREMALQIEYDSTYSQDVTVEYAGLVERQRQLERAEQDIWSVLAKTTEAQSRAAFQLLLDLVRQESQNVESQLMYYNDSAGLAALDISLRSTAATPYMQTEEPPLAGSPTPTPAPIATPTGVY